MSGVVAKKIRIYLKLLNITYSYINLIIKYYAKREGSRNEMAQHPRFSRFSTTHICRVGGWNGGGSLISEGPFTSTS